MELTRAYPSLSFDRPVAMVQKPSDSSEWYLLEQAGRIMRFANNSDTGSAEVFADLRERVNDSANESGMLSMAFHPDYADNGEVFLYYQTDEPGSDDCCVSQLVRYTVNANGDQLDTSSAEVLLSFTAPYNAKNHFGGHLGFDAAGLLYLSIGDGGSSGDPDNRAQNTANIWGSMIRIDVDGSAPYAIPADNPFAEQSDFLCNTDAQMQSKQAADGACPELYAWGLRNPWRWSFDRANGEIWLADVGQGSWEEVNRIQRGGNYGWRIREGAHCYNPSSGCDTTGLIDPVAEVPQPEFQSITGGYRYRGSDIPGLTGRYVFSDFVTGPLYSLVNNGQGGWSVDPLIADTGQSIAAFAEDQQGELYALSFAGGIYRLAPGDQQSNNAPEQYLSATGCVEPTDPQTPASGLVPYQVRAPFWSDGAAKQRWLALPNNTQISADAEQDWQLPVGSVLVKNFYLADALIETRLFKHHDNGEWAGYSYAWNEAGTDAELIVGGAEQSRAGQSWIYPSASQCLQCHTEAAGFSLGLQTAQLNFAITYPSTGRSANQIETLQAVGMLGATDDSAPLADPLNQTLPVNDRARAYLHTNCAQCHQPGGNTNVAMDLRAARALPDMGVCNVPAQNGDVGISDARLVLPGDADRSVLLARIALRDHAQQMPPIGSNLVDVEGEALLREWINGLALSDCE
ncbi:PQQ-dependent sugar dehydrogenase [uncultured Gilvimarinus sp.]|uniref:PQQ-dependent sugar dehydrogenase n=1 Tax=uncultured Gilvimarinus sp. TaxID=1689143 RepID=UPI0030DD8916